MRFLALFALVSIAEIATFVFVESQIGLAWSLAIALMTAIVGSFMVRRAGAAAWQRLRRRVSDGRMPGREVSDGAAILVAGAFLISPGFLTDLAGFSLLIPAVRAIVYQRITNRFQTSVRVYVPGDRPIASQEIIDVEEIE